jgi:hypothetical protein
MVEYCTVEAVRIAQREIELATGQHSDDFVVILAAGAVRGMSLFSDVDFLVLAGDNTESANAYAARLAHGISWILTTCGFKPDNLIERFLGQNRLSLAVDELTSILAIRDSDAFFHALLDTRPLPGIGSIAIDHRFRALKNTLVSPGDELQFKRWRTFYLRQLLRKGSSKKDCLLPASIRLRDLTILYSLARLSYNRASTVSPDDRLAVDDEACPVRNVLESMQKTEMLTREECRAVLEAYEYFTWLRNAGGLLYHGIDSLIAPGDMPQLLDSGGSTRTGEDPALEYRTHVKAIEIVLERLMRYAGHGTLALKMVAMWAAILRRWSPFIYHLAHGDARVRIEAVQQVTECVEKAEVRP